MIREATLDDLERLTDLGEEIHTESRYSKWGFNREKTRIFIHNMMAMTDGIVLVAELDGEIIGGLVAYVGSHYFDDARVATDYCFYITPEHRGKPKLAYSIVKKYIELARDLGAQDIILSTSTGINPEEFEAFCTKAFNFHRCGATMVLQK